MAHALVPSDKQANVAYLKGALQIPWAIDLFLNDAMMQEMSGSVFVYLRPDGGTATVRLRYDGTVVPAASPHAEGYWFIHDRGGRSILALASQGDILAEFTRGVDGSWRDLRCLRPQTDREHAASRLIESQRWFTYERVGHSIRRIELLAGGAIGEGAAGCEQQWYIVEGNPGSTEPEVFLVLAGEGRETCRLKPSQIRGSDGSLWEGKWINHERMPVRLQAAAPPDASSGGDK